MEDDGLNHYFALVLLASAAQGASGGLRKIARGRLLTFEPSDGFVLLQSCPPIVLYMESGLRHDLATFWGLDE